MRFESFDFAPEILRAVSDCGYQEMTPVQRQAIPTIRRGLDVLASAQTGTSTVGIRGLRAQDLAASQPNINAVLMMETLRLDANAAQGFAAEAQWQRQAVDALPLPPQPHSPGADPLRDRP